MTETPRAEPAIWDVAVIGAGPAGLSAAIYTSREDLSTVILEGKVAGGLVGVTDMIDNYPGFPDGIVGLELSAGMEKQARRFGADIRTGLWVKSINDRGGHKVLETSQGELAAKAVLIATGSDYRKLGIPGEAEYTGRGVHYCATCDGPLYRGKRLVVVGGGNSAMQESLFLAKFASEITILVRGPRFKGTEVLMEEVKAEPKIKVHYNVSTTAVKTEDSKVVGIEGVNQAGKTVEFDADGIFVHIGLLPNTAWLKGGRVELDERGLVKADGRLQTSMPGVFVAGDVRSGSTFQVASAVGEGATAALMIREYLKALSTVQKPAAA